MPSQVVIGRTISCNTTTNTGIKARTDCRTAALGGVGSFLNTPFSGWSILSAPYNYGFPSDGTSQKVKITASSSNFTFLHNNTLTLSYTNNATSLMNTAGAIGFANHNAVPINLSWIRAYPSTSNIITVSVSLF